MIDAILSMKPLPLTFAILTAICGLAAAYYAYQAASVGVKPVWDYDESLAPKSMAEDAFGTANAVATAQFWAGRYSTKAAIWSFGAVGAALVGYFFS